jgi:hypothetical protein
MKRFSLRALLILVTALGLFCGYSQWRRHHLLRTCSMLEQRGISIQLPSSWQDRVWQRLPSREDVFVFVSDSDLESKALLSELGLGDFGMSPNFHVEVKAIDPPFHYDQSLITEDRRATRSAN